MTKARDLANSAAAFSGPLTGNVTGNVSGNAGATCKKLAVNSWIVFGDLS